MRRQIRFALLASVVLAAVPAFAKDEAKPAAPPAPAPPAELSQLAFFEGNWTCSGTTYANPMGPEHATTAKVKGSKAVGGAWVHVTYDEDKTAANPNPYHAGVYFGYDAAKKTFVQFCADSYGAYCNATSAGWNGDALVFEGTSMMDGKPAPARDNFARKGANELTHSSEMQGDDKKWVKIDEEHCKRAK
jgi:hypothetical protein